MASSPDKKHKADLIYQGEIRFGPTYYTLEIDNTILKNKTFGDKLCFSNDSKYLAIQEWLTTDYVKGPITRVMLFDIDRKLYSTFKPLEKGYVQNFKFENNLLIYTRFHAGEDINEEVEVDLSSISVWKSIDEIN